MWKHIIKSVEIASYKRAAFELTRLGYHKEAATAKNMIHELTTQISDK